VLAVYHSTEICLKNEDEEENVYFKKKTVVKRERLGSALG
jgi:hypothetical protein